MNLKTVGLTLAMAIVIASISPCALASDAAPLPPGPGDSMNWTPDQQIVGYREIARIYPVRMVARGSTVHGLPLAVHPISPRWQLKGEAMDVDRFMEATRASGVIVLKDGAVVLERYGLGRTAQDRWWSQSVGKSITSILVGAAIQDGFIKSLNDQVPNYIPELKGTAFDGVTLRDLLTMTSGVKWNEDYTDPKSDPMQMFSQPVTIGSDPIVPFARRLTRAHAPGSTFQYKGIDPVLAGRVVSRAVGRSLSEYLSEKLWKPYGMDHDASWSLAAGLEDTQCCVSATLRDFARIGQFMLDGGKIGDVQVLPPDYLAESTKPLAPQFNRGNSNRIGYGYYWWCLPDDGFAAIGIQGQVIAIFPKEKLIIAINSAWPNSSNHKEYEDAAKTFGEARDAFIEAVRQETAGHAVGPVRRDCDGC